MLNPHSSSWNRHAAFSSFPHFLICALEKYASWPVAYRRPVGHFFHFEVLLHIYLPVESCGTFRNPVSYCSIKAGNIQGDSKLASRGQGGSLGKSQNKFENIFSKFLDEINN